MGRPGRSVLTLGPCSTTTISISTVSSTYISTLLTTTSATPIISS